MKQPTKSGPRPATPVTTTELCKYGCGNVATHQNKSGGYLCESATTKCPANRKKNSKGLKTAYKDGIRTDPKEVYQNTDPEAQYRMNWNKDKRYADFSYEGKGDHKSALILERGHKCEWCENTEWLANPITLEKEAIVLELDNIDGDRKNNGRDNLRILCPNCHSKTPTWRKGKNKGKKVQLYSDEEILEAASDAKNLQQILDKLDLRWGSGATVLNALARYGFVFPETPPVKRTGNKKNDAIN